MRDKIINDNIHISLKSEILIPKIIQIEGRSMKHTNASFFSYLMKYEMSKNYTSKNQ